MTVYLCTSGTSASKTLPKEEPFDAAWVRRHGGVREAARRLLETFMAYSMNDDEALHTRLSAEIHSLARMPLREGDRVVFFASETEDGQVCAEAVRQYLHHHLPGVETSIEVVLGLQVEDERRFRTQGVVEFVRKALRKIEEHGSSQCVLNPTGGFKALVPYTVLLGMLKQVPARYIFEQSKTLITLPPLPVEFARSHLEPVRALLEEIERETAVPRRRIEEILPRDEREALSPLFEEVGGAITLSAIGHLVKEDLFRPSALTPFLSRKGLEGLLALRKRKDCDPERYLQRIGRNRAALEQDKHGNAGEGLTWLKPGNTPDRYLVSEEGWRLLVWEVCDHEEYERRSAKRELGQRVRSERASKYAPFVRMEFFDGD